MQLNYLATLGKLHPSPGPSHYLVCGEDLIRMPEYVLIMSGSYNFVAQGNLSEGVVPVIAPYPAELSPTTPARWLSDVAALSPSCSWATPNVTENILFTSDFIPRNETRVVFLTEAGVDLEFSPFFSTFLAELSDRVFANMYYRPIYPSHGQGHRFYLPKQSHYWWSHFGWYCYMGNRPMPHRLHRLSGSSTLRQFSYQLYWYSYPPICRAQFHLAFCIPCLLPSSYL